MPATERRKHRRLPLRLPLAYRSADAGGAEAAGAGAKAVGAANTYTGRAVTANISTVGMYFEADDASLHEGMALALWVTVPPAPGVSPFDTEVRTTGEIVRLVRRRPSDRGDPEPSGRSGVAVRFSRPLQYDFLE